MSGKRAFVFGVALLCLVLLAPVATYAQSASTGAVVGTVLDPQKAAVAGAEVTLTQHGTTNVLTTATDAAGHYVFPAVTPGDYTLKVSAKGFRASEIGNVHVEVLRSNTVDISLELGAASEVVEVKEVMGAELETTNASVGTVLSGDTLVRLPSQQRSVTAFLMLQPGVSPGSDPKMKDDINGGQVAGSTSDQTTFLVDGGDATSDLEGTNNYVSPPGEPQPAPFIAVPAESVQEFRVVTASPTASFSRSMGGEVSVLTKQGTNSIHGSAYEYYYGSGTSANDWQLNSIGRPRPHQVNNRFGASGGGAIWKDKLFIYGDYEGRHLNQATTITQLVPTATARMGIIQFRDCASMSYDPVTGACNGTGNVNAYNLNLANGPISTLCSATQNMTCDPRTTFPAGFTAGVDPTICCGAASYFSLLPIGNNTARGDGLNSVGFTASFAQPTREDIAVGRVDYNINSRWSIFGTYHYNRYRLPTTQQFDITQGHTPQLISQTPVEPRFVTFMLTGQIGSHFTSQTHGSWMRDWWAWNRAALTPQIAGLGGAINLSGEARIAGTASTSKIWGDPVNFDTQDARSRLWFGKDWYLAQDGSWIHGKHLLQFGGAWYYWNLEHLRTDVVTGGLTTGPTYYVGQTVSQSAFSNLNMPSSQRPPICSAATVSTNCLLGTAGRRRWQAMYGSLLGLVGDASQIGTRDGNFTANTLGAPLIDNVHTHTFETYFQDVWKFRPSITITYGMTYGVQFGPHEINGKQVLQVWGNNNTPLENVAAYFRQRDAALSNGQFFASGSIVCGSGTPFVPAPCNGTNAVLNDTTWGFSPIRHVPGRTSSSDTQWNNFGPRVAVAWQVPYNNIIFGNNQTVIRAGYSILWNRTNGVTQALIPLLGDGLASAQLCNGVAFVGAGGAVGPAQCTGAFTDATNGYRLGVDGTSVPIPPVANAPIPLVPIGVNSAHTSNLDPHATVPYAHNVTVDVQRAFPHNWLVDVGFIGRFARNTWQNVDINAADLRAKTPACTANGTTCQVTTTGQTLAQAYNAVNAGGGAQPFFENAPFGCAGCTALISAIDGGDPSLFTFSNLYDRILLSGNPATPGMTFTTGPQPLNPLQLSNDNWTADVGRVNYAALFVSARKSMSNGLDLSFNYTWSHGIGTGGQNFLGQQYTGYSSPDSFDPNTSYASSNGDRRHVINTSVYYELPFGRGKRYSSSNNIVNRIIGGWYVSGIYQWSTGLPVCIGADGDYGAPNGFTCAIGASFYGSSSAHRGVTGSSGIGTTGNVNFFSNPAAVFNALRAPLPGVDGRPGQDSFSTPREWNIDLGFGKNVWATERYKVVFSCEMFNAFNHPQLGANFDGTWTTDLGAPSSFGVLSEQTNSPRSIQFGLRFEF